MSTVAMDVLTAPLADLGPDMNSASSANFLVRRYHSMPLTHQAPTWGSYLYQNALPNLPNDWLLNAGLNNNNNPNQQQPSLFSPEWSALAAANSTNPMLALNEKANNYYMNVYGGSIAPSLLAPSASGSSGSAAASPPVHVSPSVDMVDKIVASPSPLHSLGGSPPASVKSRRSHAFDLDADGEVDTGDAAETRSQHSHHSEDSVHDHDHDHDEGVERDGMIWGMKVEEYRALSARERKRVRNRISARTFRAKRKEHLTSLESTLGAKDLEIRLAHEENVRLRREVTELKRRLAQYESGKPY